MKQNKISIKSVINQSLEMLKGSYSKAFLSSLVQFSMFLATYLLTSSILLSTIVWLLFLPNQIGILASLKNGAKIEDLFKKSFNWKTVVCLAIICTLCYVFGFVLAIVPAILFFVNFAFVAEFAQQGADVHNAFAQSKKLAKGYRGKILLFGLIYLFILLIIVALTILLTLLVSYVIPMANFHIYSIGSFVGIGLFLIFVAPLQTLGIRCLKNAIEQAAAEQPKNEQTTIEQTESKTNVDQTGAEPAEQNNHSAQIQNLEDDLLDQQLVEPSDYIV